MKGSMRVLLFLVAGASATTVTITDVEVTFIDIDSDNSNCPYQLPTNGLILDTRTSAEFFGLGDDRGVQQITELGQGNGGQVALTQADEDGFCQEPGRRDVDSALTTSETCVEAEKIWVSSGNGNTSNQKASIRSLDPSDLDTDIEFIQVSWRYGSFYNDGRTSLDEEAQFTGDQAQNIGYINRVRAAFFSKYNKELNANTPIYAYCRTGGRSGEVARYLQENGYPLAMNIGGWWDKNNNWFHEGVFGFAFGRLSNPLCGIPARCPYGTPTGKLVDVSSNGAAQAGLGAPYQETGYKAAFDEAFQRQYGRTVTSADRFYVVGDVDADVDAAIAALSDYTTVKTGAIADLPLDRSCGSGDADAVAAENTAVFACLYSQANCQLTERAGDINNENLCTPSFDCSEARAAGLQIPQHEPVSSATAAGFAGLLAMFALLL